MENQINLNNVQINDCGEGNFAFVIDNKNISNTLIKLRAPVLVFDNEKNEHTLKHMIFGGVFLNNEEMDSLVNDEEFRLNKIKAMLDLLEMTRLSMDSKKDNLTIIDNNPVKCTVHELNEMLLNAINAM